MLYDSEGTIKDLDKKLNDSSYTLPTLFNWLNASRTILEAGDFWLLLLGGVLVLVFKAAAPLLEKDSQEPWAVDPEVRAELVCGRVERAAGGFDGHLLVSLGLNGRPRRR